MDRKRAIDCRLAAGLCCVFFALAAGSGLRAESEEARVPERPWEVIDVVIALDTSGSMKALIDGARLMLWEIVSDLLSSEPTPTLRFGLVSYGGQENDWRKGWVRIEADLTEELDHVSASLFALEAEAGGGEYVARALEAAMELDWTESEDALKLLFVVGNESADQDPEVSFREMSDRARRAGISVHAIFCGPDDHEDAESWKEAAELAAGEFAAIDHRAGSSIGETPFDTELAALGVALDETFLPLGEDGRRRHQSSRREDESALELGPAVAAARAQAKAGRSYSAGWDLLEALEANAVELAELEESELPAELRQLGRDEREAYLEQVRVTRSELRDRIAVLSAERRRALAAQGGARDRGGLATLDSAVRRAIREEAERHGFRFPEE